MEDDAFFGFGFGSVAAFGASLERLVNFLKKLFGISEVKRHIQTPDFSNDAVEFVRLNPSASIAEWQDFSTTAAVKAYQAGFAAGANAATAVEVSGPTPEEVADVETPGWRESAPIDPAGKELAPMIVDAMILDDAREK